ncbi:hypothetical protein A0H81_13659 [Grifola frondosa]|uniref:Uncharacterized protein n=1 Tax=Grifola frondosa TaxID=5627 RepID=A0A1C7LNP8_GRIFR|nr:hypothetical protein A0H81_13659 [Grifola frondosa]
MGLSVDDEETPFWIVNAPSAGCTPNRIAVLGMHSIGRCIFMSISFGCLSSHGGSRGETSEVLFMLWSVSPGHLLAWHGDNQDALNIENRGPKIWTQSSPYYRHTYNGSSICTTSKQGVNLPNQKSGVKALCVPATCICIDQRSGLRRVGQSI